MVPMKSAFLGTVVVFALSASCGGKVVFETSGSGGSGGTGSSTHASTTGVGTTSSTGTGGSCTALSAAVDQATAAAQACNPLLNIQQCDGSVIVNDKCGCPSLLLNEKQPDKVAAAKKAIDAWLKAGCGPLACGAACFPATSGFCQPNANGTGICVTAMGI